MLINGSVAHPKHVLSHAIFPGSRGHGFPGSRAIQLCDIVEGSRDESHVWSCDMFPWSHDAEVTDL